VSVDFTPDEQRLVLEFLQRDLGDLRDEISNTDNSHFHDQLKRREALLLTAIAKLEAAAP
jgi:hypothetical protein